MISNIPPQVSIDIQGNDEQAVKATTAVVSEALRSHGFTHVSVENLDVEAGAPAGVDSAVSILDLARMSRPGLFATPVEITFSSVQQDAAEEASDVDEAIDDAIASADEAAGIYG